ncbi:MAG: AAA family ATPase [Stigonema ocellatum SAG 48.90 = DSM 106950]|nr:AAA family ATPase [Stigonema ocellatum SAG 48.90 = DSM 106950]
MASTQITISGYQVKEQIYESCKTLVYRAIREIDQKPVVIKMLKALYPTFTELIQFRNQYTITQNIHSSGIIETYSLEPYQNVYALVMEDFGGISLKEWMERKEKPLSLSEFLPLAIALCNTLDILYHNRIIHKDIKLANILINPETQQVKLSDFSIASLLPRETQILMSPNLLEGTLGYLSPEQTGRMNRGIDYRTDFYSLGVSFYELLTGELPFQCEDAMELIHCHIAKKPNQFKIQDSKLKNAEPIPQVLADIVIKLMAKNPEERYQSALGLKYDLENCLEQLKTTGKIESFPIAQRDVCDRFIIPDRLYGRDHEVQALLDAFERVADNQTEIMLVAGFSGIGKTAIVNEIHKPIVRQRGYFIKGKFDQFNRNIPFSAFVQAFRDLMGQLNSESDTQLSRWKGKILEAVGENGQVIIEVIPELERIIGKQPDVPKLSGNSSQNRFNLVFGKFIRVFTTKEHPLVIFLDDLQWADSASLNLLKLLKGESDTGYLLVLGAYRNNEVFPAHPLMLTLDELQKKGTTINTIILKPLAQNYLNQLVADTLCCAGEVALPLTKLVYQKTQGNPFFVTQFLKSLYEDSWIIFDREVQCWQCDMAQVRQLALTDDVVEFMAQRLHKLPDATQKVLKLAACIGNQFDLGTLAVVCERSKIEVATDLWKALQEGLVLPISEAYKFFQGSDQKERRSETVSVGYQFLHDRIQQAAYTLIADDQKQSTHLKIGQLLLYHTPAQEQEEKIFAIVNQLNLGKVLLIDEVARLDLIRLNLQAGQKAKISAAYQVASNYFAMGMELLPCDSWTTQYDLTYRLYRERSETEYLSGNFEQAEALYRTALVDAKSVLDRVGIYGVQMTQYQLQGRNAEAMTIQKQSLALLGWQIPTPEEVQTSLDGEIATVSQLLGERSIESILDLPKMHDSILAKMMEILQILFYAAWLDGQTQLAFLALAKMTALSLQYGNSEMSPFGYGGYAMISMNVLKDYGTAHRFGEMSVKLCEQFDNSDVTGMTNFLFAADLHSWSRPLKQSERYYENAYRYGMEAGNWLTVGYMMMQSGSDRLTYGKNLNELYDIAQSHASFLKQVKSDDKLDTLIVGVIQPIRNLLALTHHCFTFDDDSFSEEQYLSKYAGSPYYLAWFYSVKIRHAYLLGDRSAWQKLIPTLSIIENTIPSHAKVPSSVFYVALMHVALYAETTDAANRQAHWQALEPLERSLNFWSFQCPENILHKCLLLQAEKARVTGLKTEAINLYDRAITIAKENEYIYEEALANELVAKFYLEWGKEKAAVGYMQEAYYCYARWGAKAKIDDLEKQYPQLLKPILQKKQLKLNLLETIDVGETNLSTCTSSIGSSSISNALDFTSILKAAQAISSSIKLDELIASLTRIILENSGAKKSVLILPQNNTWQVRAITSINQEPNSQTNIQTLLDSQFIDTCQDIPLKIIYYVKNTQKTVVINNLKTDIPGVIGEYMLQHQPQSVLCTPIINQGYLVGILYLENQLTSGVFTDERLQIVNLLASQAAIALENALLYQQAQQALQDLQQAQLQIVQSEKMSALGNLVAGVAHEMNNPLGFIAASLEQAKPTFADIIEHLQLYQKNLPNPVEEIIDHAEEIDLDYSLEDLSKMIESMVMACDRLKKISNSLRTFSRSDKDYKVNFSIHEGIESTILILKHRLKANDKRPDIEIFTNYDDLPLVECFPGQLNQVFMNILANAIDALEESNIGRNFRQIQAKPNRITITTSVTGKNVKIAIADNGNGIREEVKQKIFNHLFTTKDVGKGTGLGLTIARQIVEETHNGKLICNSVLGEGTEFVIEIPLS